MPKLACVPFQLNSSHSLPLKPVLPSPQLVHQKQIHYNARLSIEMSFERIMLKIKVLLHINRNTFTGTSFFATNPRQIPDGEVKYTLLF